MSAKNLTLYIPADVVQKMDLLQEVNWSKIARDAIENYVNERLSTSIPPDVLGRLKKEMGEEFVNGKKLATEHILPHTQYKELASFFETARSLAHDERARYAAEAGVEEEMVSLDVEGQALGIIKGHFGEIPKHATERFCIGVFSVLNETWKVLEKSESGSE